MTNLVVGASLSDIKKAMIAKVDSEAETLRASIITLGAGQAMAYDQKRIEAEQYLATYTVDETGQGSSPLGPGTLPHIYAEAAIEGKTPFGKAQEIVESAYLWTVMSSRIEAVRIGAHAAINRATTPPAARAAAKINWDGVLS